MNSATHSVILLLSSAIAANAMLPSCGDLANSDSGALTKLSKLSELFFSVSLVIMEIILIISQTFLLPKRK